VRRPGGESAEGDGFVSEPALERESVRYQVVANFGTTSGGLRA